MLKNGELLNLYKALDQLGNLSGVKFAYGVSKNISLIKPEIELLEKALLPSNEYKKFDDERIELVKKFTKKDKDGKPVMIRDLVKGESYDIEEGKQAELDKEFEVLKKANQKVYDLRQKQIEEYLELLKVESQIKLHKIMLSDVPKEITVRQMHGLSEIITDEIVSPYK